MKKTYQNPTTEIIILETQPVMGIASGASGTLSAGSEGDFDSGSMEIESRSGGWFDDEE